MKKSISVTIALGMSLFLYVFYRSEKTLVNELISWIAGADRYMSIRNIVTYTLPLDGAIIYSLPGGLWVFCATALARDFFVEISRRKIHLVFVPVIFAIALELCQLVHLTRGRFDFSDIAMYLTFCLLAYYSFETDGTRQNILAPFTFPRFVCLACFFSVYLAHVTH